MVVRGGLLGVVVVGFVVVVVSSWFESRPCDSDTEEWCQS